MRKQLCATASRRGLLTGAIIIGSSIIFAKTMSPSTSVLADGDMFDGVQYGFMVSVDKCVGCGICIAACRKYNELTGDAPDRRRLTSVVDSRGFRGFVSTSCMHCAEPSCLVACPAGAITKGAAGIVSVDRDSCIGCKYCFQACPYAVPRYSSVAMDKCDCCLGAGIEPGKTPYCVRNCKFDALQYGPIDELVAKATDAVQVGQANDPSCWLVGARR